MPVLKEETESREEKACSGVDVFSCHMMLINLTRMLHKQSYLFLKKFWLEDAKVNTQTVLIIQVPGLMVYYI
jgi:hypothetical protein